MELKYIFERLDLFNNFIGFRTHVAINNAFGGNMEMVNFDQWLHSKHIDHLRLPEALLIPPMTNPLGKYWKQPNFRHIYIDEKTARLRVDDFEKLLEYSSSIPSGVYIGKIWKRKQLKIWYLCWFSRNENPDLCTIDMREIELIPERNYRYEMDEQRTLSILKDGIWIAQELA